MKQIRYDEVEPKYELCRYPIEDIAIVFDQFYLVHMSAEYEMHNGKPDAHYKQKLTLTTPIQTGDDPRARYLFVAGDYVIANLFTDRDDNYEPVLTQVTSVKNHVYQHPLNPSIHYIINQDLEVSIVKE